VLVEEPFDQGQPIGRIIEKSLKLRATGGELTGAILSLQKVANKDGGYANLETGVIYRRAMYERVSHNKVKPPVKMAPSLLAHMKRWARLDQGIRWYVHYNGQPITKLNKAWRGCCRAAGLDPEEVVPHVLRHTRGTWLAQASVDDILGDAAGW
jgi:integrase